MRRVLLLLVLPLLLLGPALLPGRLFLPQLPVGLEPLASEYPEAAARAWRDASFLTADRLFPLLTDERAVRAQLSAGVLPTWQPLQGLGAPLFAGTIVGPAYPPNWLRYLGPPELMGGWLALLSLFLAGLGIWLLLERLGLEFGPCAVGALAVQAGGFAALNLHYVMKVDAALWLPWSLWAVEGLVQGRARAGFALFLSTALSFLAGFPSIAVFGALATAAYALWRTFQNRGGLEPLMRAGLFLGLGLAGASVQLVPMAEASLQSYRQPQAAADLVPQSLPLASSLTLVAPELFGAPDSPVFAGADPVTWWLTRAAESDRTGNANALEWNLFVGVLVVGLALLALLNSPRRALFPALLALASIAFAQAWPLVRLAYHLPGLSLGSPARAAAVGWIAWPWLAALGAAALIERPARGAATVAGLALVLAVLGASVHQGVEAESWSRELVPVLAERHGIPEADVVGLLPGWVRRDAAERLRASGLRLALLALAAAAFAIAAALLAHRGRAHWAWIPLGLVIALEGWLAGAPHLAPRVVDDDPLFPPSAVLAAIAEAAGDGRVLRFDESESGVADVLELARPNLPEAYGIADLTPYLVFTPRRLVELFETLDPRVRFRSSFSRIADERHLASPVLDLARVTAILSRRPLEHPRLEPVFEHRGFHVYRRSGALPTARLATTAITTPSDAVALGLLAGGTLDLSHTTVLAPEVAARPLPTGEARPGTLRVDRPSPARLDVEVRGTSGGWLVMSEAFYPTWKATVDGEDAAVVRADHACRAVFVPPGDHLIRTKYEPWSLRFGAALTLLALLTALWRLRRAVVLERRGIVPSTGG